MNKKNQYVILALFIILGGILRFYNLNWDQGHFFHPDERNIANAVSRIRFFSQLNPEFFAYGGFSIYLYRAIGDAIVFLTKNAQWVTDWGLINLIARYTGAFFSTLTIIPLFFLSKKVFNLKTALVASLLFVFSVFSIQTAHFGITENLFAFLSITTCLTAVFIYKKPTVVNSLFLGAVIGVMIATKTTALTLGVIPAATYLLLIKKVPIHKLALLGTITLAVTSVLFVLFSPYTFIRWDKFMESMRYESGVALGTLPVPYTLQFTNTPPYFFQLKNFFWQLGPLALVSLAGFAVILVEGIRKKEGLYILFIVFPLMYFLYVGSWYTKFIRFMVPILPFLVISGAYILVVTQQKYRAIGTLLLVLVIGFTMLWAMAFMSIYTKEQTRITASKWIYNNIAQGSVILGEHWDDGLPIPMEENNPSQYTIEQLTLYDEDSPMKRAYLAQKLSSADYIVINSRRLYGTLMYLPDRYPLTSWYYHQLFAGELGYRKVAEFTSYPRLFGIQFNDDASEETFQVYDHPKVLIFENSTYLSSDEIERMLQ